MRETWYVLEDDTVVHPGEVDHTNMTHKNGKVAMRGDVPSTRGVEVDENGQRIYEGPHDHLDERWNGSGNPPKDAVKPTFEAELEAKTVNDLKALAAEKGVDLGEATKKADIVAVLAKALEPDAASGGYKTREITAG